MVARRKKLEPVSERFARAVIDARERRGLSQAELAERIGVSLNHVSKLEREVYSASLEMAARFIVELDLDANELVRAKPSARNVSKKRREIEGEIIRLIEGMDERMLDRALEISTALAKR
jgi:ribosome-binding protein aMBF1 (putative translation factor)